MTADQLERTGVLVYDADCGFCTRFAAWVGPAVPWQELDLKAAGTTAAEMTRAAGWLEDGRVTETGAAAIANALVHRGGSWATASRVLHAPVIRAVAATVYWVVARNRHLMTGGTAACAVAPEEAQSRPHKAVMVGLMVAVLIGGLLTLGYSNSQGEEPYPALLMPPFNYVPETAGHPTATSVTYAVKMDDGSVHPVDPSDFLPASKTTGYALAQRIFSAPAAATSLSTRRWLADQLNDSHAQVFIVEWHSQTYGDRGRILSDTVTRAERIPVERPR